MVKGGPSGASPTVVLHDMVDLNMPGQEARVFVNTFFLRILMLQIHAHRGDHGSQRLMAAWNTAKRDPSWLFPLK